MESNYELYYGDPSPLNGIDELSLMVRKIKPIETQHTQVIPSRYDYNKQQTTDNEKNEQLLAKMKPQPFNNATNWLL